MKLRKIVSILLALALLLGLAPSAMAAHKHEWKLTAVRVEPTCTQPGTGVYRCSCGQTKVDAIPAKGHTWSGWTVTQAATCSREGQEARTCSACGTKETRTIAKTEHRYSGWVVTREATCMAPGERFRYCQDCNYRDIGKINRQPHQWGDWEITEAATDFSAGTQAHACVWCGLEETEAYDPDPTYRIGDTGEGVQKLQEALNAAGYDCGGENGSFGSKTEAAVKAFEEANAVEPDGVAWPGVQKLLGIISTFSISLRNGNLPDAAGKGPDMPVLSVSPAVWLEPWQVQEGEKLAFDVCVRSPYDDLESAHVELIVNGVSVQSSEAGPVAAGETSSAARFEYELQAVDFEKSHLCLEFTASAVISGSPEEIPLESIPVTYDLTQGGKQILDLWADPAPVGAYQAGDHVKVNCFIYISEEAPHALELEEIATYDESDTISFEPWMGDSETGLAPGVEYSFVLDAVLSDEEISDGYGLHRVVVIARDPDGDGYECAATDIPIVLRKEGPSLFVIPDLASVRFWRTSPGLAMPVSIDVFNNGTTTLEMGEVSAVHCENEIPAASDYWFYKLNQEETLEPGESFRIDYYATVDCDDLENALHSGHQDCFRTVTVSAKDAETGKEAADSDTFFFEIVSPPSDLYLLLQAKTDLETPLSVGQKAEFTVYLVNSGTKDLKAPVIDAYDGQGNLRWDFSDALILPAGASLTYEDEYIITQKDAEQEFITLMWRAEADLENNTIEAVPASVSYGIASGSGSEQAVQEVVEDRNGTEGFRSLKVLSRPEDESSYYDMAFVNVRMSLIIDSYDEYDLIGISSAPGDTVRQADWMDEKLKAGHCYNFDYTMFLNPRLTGWKTRTVTATLRSRTLGTLETETCEVGPPYSPAKVTLVPSGSSEKGGDASIRLEVSASGFTGYYREMLSVPVHITTEGDVDIVDVQLVCDTDWNEKGFFRDATKVVYRMKPGTVRDDILHVPVRTQPDMTGSCTVTFYVTGTYLNAKGDVETAVSEKITLPLKVLDSSQQQKLRLTYRVDPERTYYPAGEEVTVYLWTENIGKETVTDAHITFDNAYEYLTEAQGAIPDLPGNGRIEPGEKALISYQYTVTKEDAAKGFFELGFIARGTAEKGGTVRSASIHPNHKASKNEPKELIGLSAAKPATSTAGKETKVTLTIRNNSDQVLNSIRIYAVGDNRNQALFSSTPMTDLGHGMKGKLQSWMLIDLKPGKSMTVEVFLYIPDTWAEGTEFQPVWIIDGELADNTPVRSGTARMQLIVTHAAD